MKKLKFFYLWYLFSAFLLFLYSYTQVDLSLTLSRVSIYQTIEKSFQYIGYFQRPFSTFLYWGILLVLFVNYIALLLLIQKKLIQKKQLWFLILATVVILIFSYNAFSYDLFNYIFDAKIFTHYHLSPYLYEALDFPKDPMLSFMHWTDRTYPYGPAWLFLTIPLSYLGFGYFALTFYIFKIFMALCFLGTAFYIGKILQKTDSRNELFGLSFFVFNPIVLIECLISAHNDIAMMFFAMLGIYLLITEKYVLAFLMIIFSALIKDVTIVIFVPLITYLILRRKYSFISLPNFFKSCIVVLAAAYIFVISRMEIQPWYFLWILPFFSLLKSSIYIYSLIIGFSLGLLLRYAPFLYYGNWNPPVPGVMFQLTTFCIFLSLTFSVFYKLYDNYFGVKSYDEKKA